MKTTMCGLHDRGFSIQAKPEAVERRTQTPGLFLGDDAAHQPWASDHMSVEVFFARAGSQRQRRAANYTMPLALSVSRRKEAFT